MRTIVLGCPSAAHQPKGHLYYVQLKAFCILERFIAKCRETWHSEGKMELIRYLMAIFLLVDPPTRVCKRQENVINLLLE